jgi:hypothetical protein
MTKDEAKAAEERAVFREFAEAAGLRLVPDSIQSRPPPEPDILCTLENGERVAFELVRLVDQDLAHVTAKAIDDPDHPQAVWFGDPTFESIEEKFEKDYVTPHPIELLAWGGDTLLPRDVWVPTFETRLRALFDSKPLRFRRLWVFNAGRLAAKDPIWVVHPPPNTSRRTQTAPLTILLRVIVGLSALAMASPLPWILAPRLDLHIEPAMFLIVALLAALSIPLARWAVGSWMAAALFGAIANLAWSYSLVLDPAAGPFLGLFLLAPYAAFTVSGCIGWFRERERKHRWIGVLAPPVLYILPFLVAGFLNTR